MSDLDTQVETQEDELSLLRQRADLLGIKYSPRTGVEKLKALITAALEDDKDEDNLDEPESNKPSLVDIKREALKLVRIIVTCMNPAKKDFTGEIFSVANGVVGRVAKYVPFGVEWHVEHILYEQIKNAQCNIFVASTIPGRRDEQEAKIINEYSVQVLPPLTEAELKELARKQAMASGHGE